MTSIVTYRSENAQPGKEWAAYVDLGTDYLGIRFHGSTEAEAIKNAEEFWAKDQKKREQTAANRAAANERQRKPRVPA